MVGRPLNGFFPFPLAIDSTFFFFTRLSLPNTRKRSSRCLVGKEKQDGGKEKKRTT